MPRTTRAAIGRRTHHAQREAVRRKRKREEQRLQQNQNLRNLIAFSHQQESEEHRYQWLKAQSIDQRQAMQYSSYSNEDLHILAEQQSMQMRQAFKFNPEIDYSSNSEIIIERNAENLLLENEEFTIVIPENYTIKTEPEDNELETLIDGIKDDSPSLESDNTVQMMIKHTKTESAIKQLTENKSDVKKYKIVQRSDSRFVCDICGKKSACLSAMKIHRRTHTGEKPYTCTECNQHFSVKQSLNLHMLRHTGKKPYSCTQCDKTFVRKDQVGIHMRQHTGEKPFSCTECDRNFTRREQLGIHMRRHTGEKPFSCLNCDKSFTTKDSLKRHMSCHTRETTAEKPFNCTECKQRFARKYTLNLHMRLHTGEKPYKCPECDQNFAVKHGLKYHMKRHTGGKAYTCIECDKNFVIKQDLDVHMRLHTGEKTYTCTKCRKNFTGEQEYQIHIRQHAGDKRYSCTECNKTLYDKSTFNIHMMRHTGEKPHICLECGKRFVRAIELRYHSKTHLLRFACEQCEGKFKTKRKLEQHTRIHSSKSKKDCQVIYAAEDKFKIQLAKQTCSKDSNMKKEPTDCVASYKDVDSSNIFNSSVLEIHRKQPKTFHKSVNARKIELNNSKSLLTRVYRINDFSGNVIENVTSTDNNVMQTMNNEEQILYEDNVIVQHFIKDEVCEPNSEKLLLETEMNNIITRENESIRMKQDPISFECDSAAQQLIKEEVTDAFTALETMNVNIVPKDTVTKNLLNAIKDDQTSIENINLKQEFIKHEVLETSTDDCY